MENKLSDCRHFESCKHCGNDEYCEIDSGLVYCTKCFTQYKLDYHVSSIGQFLGWVLIPV